VHGVDRKSRQVATKGIGTAKSNASLQGAGVVLFCGIKIPYSVLNY
jgi:hypothetical protein